MRKNQLLGGVAAAAATIMLLAGCSSDGEPTKEADKSGAAAAAGADTNIDVAALDVGKYPTSPRPPFGKVGEDRVIQWESQRMAQFMVVPFEVDSDLTSLKMPTGVVSGPNNLKSVVAPSAAASPANSKIVSGFVTTFGTPDANIREGNSRSMNNWVGRYLTPADATAAATEMADATAKESKSKVTTDPALPQTKLVAGKSVRGDGSHVAAFTAHDVYVLYQWYGTKDKQQDMQIPAITKAVKLQSKLIDQFPRTLTKAEREARKLPRTQNIQDQNGVLIYALPYSDEELKSGKTAVPEGLLRAVYGARGMSLINDDPASTFKTLSDAGAQQNAMERSNVYRAKDQAGAKTVLDFFVNQKKTAGAWKSVESPKGLPIAPCFSRALEGGDTFFACNVQKGRYVGEVSSKESLLDAQQQISAQYAIFTKADQNAK